MPETIREQAADEWFIARVNSLSGGLNFNKSAEQIEDDELRECDNIRFEGDKLIRDTGYKALAQTSGADVGDPYPDVLGVPRKTFEFKANTGQTETLLVTNLTVFKRNPTYWDMLPLNGGASTTLNANEPAGSTAIDVADTAGFAAGDVVEIMLDDGRGFTTTVTSIFAPGAPGVLVIPLPGLPSAATTGNAVTQGMALSGDADHEVVFTTINNGANPWVVFTNGVDPVARYDGVDMAPVPGLSGISVTAARTVGNHTGHLVLGATTEVGSQLPFRVRWSDTNDPTNWSTGNAGFEDQLDTRDDIVAMLQLAQEVAIYRSRSIVMMEFEGSATRVFFFRPVVFGRSEAAIGVGAVSANSVAAAGSAHMILSHDGIYRYAGGLALELVSLKVDDFAFGSGGEISRPLLHRSFVQFIDARNELMIAYCKDGQTYPNQALMLNLETGNFWRRVFTRNITSAESHSSNTGITIADLEGTIAEQLWIIGSGLTIVGSPTILITSDSSGNQVYEYDFVSTTDAGMFITWRLTTKIWKAFVKQMRWQWHQFRIRGEGFVITAISGGASFPIAVLVTTTTYASQRYALEILGESLQYRMAGTGSFELGDLAYAAREETNYHIVS